MKLIRMTVRRGVTVNVGNYENIRTDVELTADIDDDEELLDVYDNLHRNVEKLLMDQVCADKAGKR